MRRLLVLCLFFACAKTASYVSPVPAIDAAAAPEPIDAATVMIDAYVEEAPVDSGVEDTGWTKPPPKRVLHVGDSMVGAFGGLTKALENHFKPLGAKFTSEVVTSLSVQTFARDKKLDTLIAKNDPDLVIITLGANDILAPFPKSLAAFIAAIAKKTTGRECWWLPPVPWKEAVASGPGFIQVVKDNAAPCKVYDGSGLTIARQPDGIHPSDRGGQVWADGFLKAYEAP